MKLNGVINLLNNMSSYDIEVYQKFPRMLAISWRTLDLEEHDALTEVHEHFYKKWFWNLKSTYKISYKA